jgi:hypothetical protein
MSLSGYALIAVMQTAELRDLDDLSDARDLTRKWTLLVEAAQEQSNEANEGQQ